MSHARTFEPSWRQRPEFVLRIDTVLNGLPRMNYPDGAPVANGERLRPYSAWPRCTRQISFRQTKTTKGERVFGVWRFASEWLASKLVVGATAACVENYRDEVLYRWLRHRDNTDERVTRIPDNWGVIGFYLALYADVGDCRAFCLQSGRNVSGFDLQFERVGRRKGDQEEVIRCAKGHVLLDRVTIHID